jgi:hypothetical protein
MARIMDDNTMDELIKAAKADTITEAQTNDLIDHVIVNQLTPNELMGGFDRPGWKMMAFLSVYSIFVISMFAILPLYILVSSLLAATSFVAVLKVFAVALIMGLLMSLFCLGCFLWAYEGYAYWRAKRYLADRKLKLNQIDDAHFVLMSPLLERCVRDHIKYNERDLKARLRRSNAN